ncbi:GH3 auxin-responsive promoter [Phlebopus sp. FC_14]|nr:GH3 auxin-responsive promoter [Phlebopus sp. FC_14]
MADSSVYADSSPPCPDVILLPHTVESVKDRSLKLLADIFRANSSTTFYREALHLHDLRNSGEDPLAADTVDTLYGIYRRTVPMMTYEDYRPFFTRFRDCAPVSEVKDLFAPGLPSFIAHSSGTSGGVPKRFAKYMRVPHGHRGCCAIMGTLKPTIPDGTLCIISSMTAKGVMVLTDSSGDPTARIMICTVSSGTARIHNGHDIMNDHRLLPVKVSNSTSPTATSFIPNFASLMTIHALFALADRQLAVISGVFSTVVRDFYRVVEGRWEFLIQCIEDGIIPDLEGLGELRGHLQAHFSPNVQRAEELRTIDRDAANAGWLKRVWPNLRRVVATSSGAYATVMPELRHYFGPQVEIRSLGITSTESYYALPYHPLDGERFRICDTGDFVEFLPLGVDQPSLIKGQWEVTTGEAYEIILTTRDGLWRYRLGDIVTVIGFDPRDGQPIIRFTGRSSSDFRLAHTVIPEKEVLAAVRAVEQWTGTIAEFTATADHRSFASCHGFFIEVQGELLPEASRAPEALKKHLCSINMNYAGDIERGLVGSPTIRVVRQGTFTEYRAWKAQQLGSGFGQIKIPTVTWDEGLIKWLEERVVTEL